MNRQKILTAVGLCLFLAVSFVLGLHAADRLRDRPFDPSLAALFPVDLTQTDDRVLEEAVHQKLSGEGAQTVTVLVSVKDATLAAAPRRHLAVDTAEALKKELAATGLFTPIAPTPDALENFRGTAGRLMSAEKRLELLETLMHPDADDRLMKLALQNLANPAAPKLMGFQRDPFGLFDSWIAERQRAVGTAPVMGREGLLSMVIRDEADTVTIVLPMTAAAGVAESGKGHLSRALQRARTQSEAAFAKAHPTGTLTVTAAGVPLFTDTIAATAQSELTMIGTVSSVCVLAFALFLFGRPLTVLTMALTVALGFWTGLSAALNVFGTLSLLTFVFGATLIGVTVDYSAHWFTTLTDPAKSGDAWGAQRRLAPALLLAAVSTAVAYGLLATTPLPGLKQMAVFAAAGVTGAFLTVLLLLPFAAGKGTTRARPTRLMRFFSERFPHFPRLNKEKWATPAGFVSTVLFVLFLTGGLWQLTPGTGVRDLQGVPERLVADQAAVAQKLLLPSPAQVFLIEGRTLDQVLEREEALKDAIAAMKREHPAFSAVRPMGLSDWMQSARRANADRILADRAVRKVSAPLNALLGASPDRPGKEALTLDMLSKGPAHEVVRQSLLIDNEERAATLLYLSGLTPRALPYLKRLALAKNDGITFIDMTGEINRTFADYRDRVMILLAAGLGLLLILLRFPYGREAWRSVLPAGLGILTALAVLGWAGIPFTLFSALASILLLGLGVDCGIFLSSAPTEGRAWTAVFFSGVTTMLSFGLLALSSTPALSTFGLTVLIGQLAIWLIAPLVRPKRPAMLGRR